MDGAFSVKPQRRGKHVHGCTLRSVAKSVCILALAGVLTNTLQEALAGPPALFHRSAARPQDKTSTGQEPTNLPPSPADAGPSDAVVGIEPSSSLSRFPRKSQTLIEGPTSEAEDLTSPIDLPTAFRLVGMQAPQVLMAQQRVLEATAQQQFAAAQALPNLNFGTNYDSHTGALQQASGRILQVQRSALYVGAGGNAVAAGTTNLPGLQYNLNAVQSYYGYLISCQNTERMRAAEAATRNDTLLQVATAYCQLMRAQAGRAVAVQMRDKAAEVVRITESFARIGQARPADAERAVNELERRKADVFTQDVAVTQASARLVEVLNLESSIRLRIDENWLVPRPIVPDVLPLPELIAIALYQRPEIAAERAAVHAAMLELQGAKLLIFSPQIMAGLSNGAFGGGSNINAATTGKSRFGSFGDRTDADLVMFWSIRNLGLGNKALIRAATAQLAATDFERTKQFNVIRAEVAQAYAKTQTLASQLDLRQRAVMTSNHGYDADVRRAQAAEGLPIEVLDSLRLLASARADYLNVVTEYNLAHYALYVAIGQPPADLLIRSEAMPPAPTEPAEAKE